MNTYKIGPSQITKHEIQIECAECDSMGYGTRGAALARALKARHTRDTRLWYLSENKARKWEALYLAGFDPVATTNGMTRYRFENSTVTLPLHTAVACAKAILARELPKPNNRILEVE